MMRLAAPFAVFLIVTPTAAASVEAGQTVYERWCGWCHGEKGDGNGPAARYLMPKPRDFTLGLFKYKATAGGSPPSDEDLGRIVADGMPGTSMPGWKDLLNDTERRDVIAFIKTFSDIFEFEKPGQAIPLAGQPVGSPKVIELGSEVYRKAKCAECHGDTGRGNISKKLKDDWGDAIWPRNLTKPWVFRGGSNVKDVYTRLTVGIPGTPMPVFGDPGKKEALGEEERWAVAHYVVSLADHARRPSPGATTIRAVYRPDELIAEPFSAAWDEVPSVSFRLAPQLIAADRLFTSVVDQVTTRAIYNDKEIALLIEWDDPTPSRPGDRAQANLAPGEMFEDAIAVQFPAEQSEKLEKPYFGHGDAANPVVAWHWSAGRADGRAAYEIFEMRGAGTRVERDPARSGFSARGQYVDGTWRVVFRHTRNQGNDNIAFESGRLLPVAFAAWDGSNGERGSKHTLTRWVWLWLAPPPSLKVVLVPALVTTLLAVGLLTISARVRRAGRRVGEEKDEK